MTSLKDITTTASAVVFDNGINDRVDSFLVTQSREGHDRDDNEDVQYAEGRTTAGVSDLRGEERRKETARCDDDDERDREHSPRGKQRAVRFSSGMPTFR